VDLRAGVLLLLQISVVSSQLLLLHHQQGGREAVVLLGVALFLLAVKTLTVASLSKARQLFSASRIGTLPLEGRCLCRGQVLHRRSSWEVDAWVSGLLLLFHSPDVLFVLV